MTYFVFNYCDEFKRERIAFVKLYTFFITSSRIFYLKWLMTNFEMSCDFTKEYIEQKMSILHCIVQYFRILEKAQNIFVLLRLSLGLASL
jgi:hypothetical protein